VDLFVVKDGGDALLFPKRMILIYKQRKFKRAFLVSDTFSYFGEGVYKITVLKGERKVGEILGKLIFKEIVKFGSFWHVYVFVKFIPAARSYPKLLALKNGESDTFFPVEISKFLTKYPPRDDFKYRSWYDEWIFVARFKEIFGDSL